MATIYLSSVDGNNSDDGSTWALAKATMAAAMTAAGAGGTVYVDNAHAESSASTINLPCSVGTVTAPIKVLCVDRTGNPEPPTTLATTATVTGTGNASIDFSNAANTGGFAYFYGIQFVGAGGGSSGNVSWTPITPGFLVFDSCLLRISGSDSSRLILFGMGADTRVDDLGIELRNTTVKFASVSQSILSSINYKWIGGGIAAGSSVPTILCKLYANLNGLQAELRGLDLSSMGSGKSLISASAAFPYHFHLENCKLGSSVSLTTGSIAGHGGAIVTVVNCDSADTNYRYAKICYQGDITHETTIVRNGGASDGTTAFSRKMVSSANTQFFFPLSLDSIRRRVNIAGRAITVSVEVVTDGVTLTDAEAWLELEYLGTSGYPLSLFASDRAADILATPANQTTSSESWTTTGLSSPVKQTLSKQITLQKEGVLIARVMLAKASTTMYVDPMLTISG